MEQARRFVLGITIYNRVPVAVQIKLKLHVQIKYVVEPLVPKSWIGKNTKLDLLMSE